MNEQVLLLSKKHGQLKQATTKMVQEVMGFLDDTPNLETKLSVIETLRTVTEGKVGVISTSECGQTTDCNDRSSSRSREPESRVYCQISRESRGISTPPQISYASFRWRHLDR
jgi:26S proteasome regulatory subunit N5